LNEKNCYIATDWYWFWFWSDWIGCGLYSSQYAVIFISCSVFLCVVAWWRNLIRLLLSYLDLDRFIYIMHICADVHTDRFLCSLLGLIHRPSTFGMGKNLTADIQDIQEITDQNRFNRFNGSLQKFLLSHIYVDQWISSDRIRSIDWSLARSLSMLPRRSRCYGQYTDLYRLIYGQTVLQSACLATLSPRAVCSFGTCYA